MNFKLLKNLLIPIRPNPARPFQRTAERTAERTNEYWLISLWTLHVLNLLLANVYKYQIDGLMPLRHVFMKLVIVLGMSVLLKFIFPFPNDIDIILELSTVESIDNYDLMKNKSTRIFAKLEMFIFRMNSIYSLLSIFNKIYQEN